MRGDSVGGRGGARRGRTWWDTWNDDGGDELQVAMNLLAIVRRDRAFSREVVRAFGMTRTSQARRPSRTKTTRKRRLARGN
jgi:hypothetical protein